MSDSGAKIRWQLTQAAFDRLLAALAPEREEAGERYILLRNNLLRFFETRSITSSGEAADEVLNRLARKLESGAELEAIGAYALGIARLVALEFRRIPEETAAGEMPEVAVSAEPPGDTEERIQCLEKCLGELPEENRRIIVEYYKGNKREKIDNRQMLAESLKIPLTALRNRAVRLRDKLETCIRRCMR